MLSDGRAVSGDSLGATLETRKGVRLIPGDSLGATLETGGSTAFS